MNALRWLWQRLPVPPVTRTVLRETRHYPRLVAAYVGLLAAAALLSSGRVLLLSRLVEAGMDSPLIVLGWLLAATVACWVCAQLAVYGCTTIGMKFERTVGVELVTRSLVGLLNRSAGSLRPFEPNQAVHVVRSGLKAFARKLRGTLTMVNQLIVAAFSLAAAFWLAPLLATTGLLAGILTLAWAVRHAKRQQRAAREALRGERRLHGRLWRLFEALPQIKLYGAGDEQLRRVLEPVRRQKRGEQQVLAAERRASLEVNLAAALAGMLMLLEGAWLLHQGATSVGALTAVLMAQQAMFGNLRLALAAWGQAEEGNDFLSVLLETQRKRHKPAQARSLSGPIENIECRQATLAVGETNLVCDVTCRLVRGRLYGVAGPAGSGKAMLLHLLSAGSLPRTGSLHVNDLDLSELDPNDLGKRIALVTWPPLMIDGTLAENLRLAKHDATEEELREVMAQVAFDSDLVRLERLGGLNALLGREGVQLSVGQLQRIALARALLRRPEVLLIDDLLTGLDPHSAASVLSALRERAGDRIIVLVAANDGVLRQCDEVLITEKGKLRGQFSSKDFERQLAQPLAA